MPLVAGTTGHLADHEQTAMWVNHGTSAATARPTLGPDGNDGNVAGLVIWVGTVEPTNALATDIWINNS